MFIESSGRELNDSARLYSPVYSVELIENGCFTFWYHMYGTATGKSRPYGHCLEINL